MAHLFNIGFHCNINTRSSLGRSPESWLLMQDSYDLWQAKQKVDLSGIKPIAIPA